MSYKIAVLAVAGLLGSFGTAQAADMFIGQTAPTYYDWSGYYVGGHGGYGSADFDISAGSGSPPGSPGSTLDADGGQFGILAGVNFQHGKFVYGLEGDLSWGGIDATNTSPTLPSMDIEMTGTIRGRVGFAQDHLLFFGTLGASFANVDGFEVGNGGERDSNTHVGLVAGGGVEFAVTQNVIIRGEYLHSSYDSEVYNISPPASAPHSHTIDFDTDVFRGTVMWKF